jgi:hypothetical protein
MVHVVSRTRGSATVTVGSIAVIACLVDIKVEFEELCEERLVDWDLHEYMQAISCVFEIANDLGSVITLTDQSTIARVYFLCNIERVLDVADMSLVFLVIGLRGSRFILFEKSH